MKKIFFSVIFVVFLFGCALTGNQKQNKNDQVSLITETKELNLAPTIKLSSTMISTQKPAFTETAIPTLTPTPQLVDFSSVKMGGNFAYDAFVLTFDSALWAVSEIHEDWLDYKTLSLISDPGCVFYENIPRGVPATNFELTITEYHVEGFYVSLAQWVDDVEEWHYAILNFDEINISIALEPGSDPTRCFDAAWMVIQNSAGNGFKAP